MNYAAVRHLGPGVNETQAAAPVNMARMPWELDDEHSHARQETWLLSFIDILALLLTLFVLLLAFQHRDAPEADVAAPLPAAVSPLLFTLASADSPDPLQTSAPDGYAMPGNGLVPLDAPSPPAVAEDSRADGEDAYIPSGSSAPEQVAEDRAEDAQPVRAATETPDVQTDAETHTGKEQLQVQADIDATALPAVAVAQPEAAAEPPHAQSSVAEQAAAATAQQNVAAQPERQPQAQVPPAVQTAEALQQSLRESALDERVEVTARPGAVDLVISDSILFAPASAALAPQGQALLEQLATILGTLPYTVSVEGHTDNVPIHTPQYPSNWELSAARASMVTRALVVQGVAADRLRAIGYGDTRPRNDNDTPQARAENRRVTFVLQVE